MDIFEQAIDGVIGREGRYSADPADHGGATAWGITEAVARAERYAGPMAAMPRDTAVAIYRRRYWTAAGLDRIAALDVPLAARLLDIGVNMGPATGIRFLQRALNVLNRQGAQFPDLVPDGGFGRAPEAALTAFLHDRGSNGAHVLLGMIAAQQSVHYIEIAERDPTQDAFEFGWQLNRALGAALPA